MSQKINFKRISPGLSNSTITRVYQDRYGYLWIGTRNGLNRYDGVSNKVYENTFNDTTSLSDNYVLSIYEDKQNNLWVGTNFGGLNLLSRDHDTFTRYKADNRPGDISDNAISSIIEDSEGNLWVGTKNKGLNLFLGRDKGFKHFRNDVNNSRSLSHENISRLFEDLDGNLWVGTEGGGLNLFDKVSGEFIRFVHDVDDETSIGSNFVTTIHQSSKDKIWVGTRGNGVNLLYKDTQGDYRFERFAHRENAENSISHNTVLSLCEDVKGKLWIGTENGGLNRYDPITGAFDHYYYDPNNQNSISNNSIWSIYEDNSDMLWVGTYNQGLNIVDVYSHRFKHYGINIFDQASINNGNVTSIYEDDDHNLWIGTDGGGLNFYDAKTNKFTYYRYDPNNSNSIGSDAVIGIFEDSKNNLWVGTYNGGLSLFDRKTRSFKRYKHDESDPSSIDSDNIYSILEDRKGRLWVSTYRNSIDLYDPDTDSFRHLKFDSEEVVNTVNLNAMKIFEDSEGYIWICTETGIAKLQIDDDLKVKFVKYEYDEKDAYGLSNNLVNTIFEDRNKNLWIGTGSGLNLFDRPSETFKTFRMEDGLPSNVIFGILEDDHGNLWISTSLGISKFNIQKKTFRNYDKLDGLQSNEFLRGSCFKNDDGEFYFGGINGFNVFHPDKVKDNPFIPPVYITGLSIDNVEVTPESEKSPLKGYIADTREITLNHDQSTFSLNFTALSYSQASKNKFAYKLDGYDRNWQEVVNIRSAHYNKIPPGDYTFWVKGSNNDGLWNEKITSMKITILPPLWKTWWAYCIYVLMAAAFAYMLHKNIINRERLKSNLELERANRAHSENLYRSKIQFFTNLSHELRTPLTLIIGPLEKLISMHEGSKFLREQLYIINQNSHRLLRLVTQLLDFRKAESGNLKLKVAQGNIIKFIREIILSFQGYAAQKQIELKFSSSQDDVQVYFDRDQMEKVIFNLLSNALKYTSEQGHIRIDIHQIKKDKLNDHPDSPSQKNSYFQHGYVEIAVRDDGKGIAEEHWEDIFERFYSIDNHEKHEDLGTGIGLSLAKTLVELHHGSIDVESKLGEFSCFRIRLPLGRPGLNYDNFLKGFRDSEDIYNYQKTDEELHVTNGDLVQHPSAVDFQNEDEQPILLIIEDNNDVRKYITSVFEADYKLYEAKDGLEGFELAQSVVPDLIISDVMMPKMDGITLCHKLKSEFKTSHIPIILLTARTSLIFKMEGLETGADDYITKPFNASLIKVRARNLITSRKILRKHFLNRDGMKVEPSNVSYTSKDELFLNDAIKIVEKNMSDANFTVEYLGRELGMSRMQLYRKLKSLTGFSANEFIRLLRLKRAAQLLNHNQMTISEITYEVGFTDLQYFRSCFKRQYGVNPSEYNQEPIVE
ncbi:two-component regulator propeller domain-containing protein [Fulvivirgaceae bacterium BMA12]|uniref:histidine kinase n=1 Tax=Agaribacillus aureus TaxID=3051825 RepID=A0ABT8L719_9BACT|nr:two-component regulator propeller domain-containing protein [Fulvivirgaceae bacterium BMA12]